MKIHSNDNFPVVIPAIFLATFSAILSGLLPSFLITPLDLNVILGALLSLIGGVLIGTVAGALIVRLKKVKLGLSKRYFIQQKGDDLFVVCRKFGKYYYVKDVANSTLIENLPTKPDIVDVSLAYEAAYAKDIERKAGTKKSPFVYQATIKR